MTTLHPPEDARIFLKECRTLLRAGHEVVLAAPLPEPMRVDGVELVSIGSRAARPGLLELWRRLRAARRVARTVKPDVVHLHDPELIPLGLYLHLRGARVVYDAHENVALDVATLDNGNHAKRALALAWRSVEWLGGRRFDAVVAATPDIEQLFPREKTTLVRNFPVSDEIADAGPSQRERDRAVIYVGRMSDDRGLGVMLQAAAATGVELRLAGLGPDQLLADLAQRPSVVYRGWLTRPEIAAELRSARAGLVVLQPRAAYLESLPVKLFEYMAAGVPVIASDFPRWRALVDGCAVFVDPSDPQAVADAITWVLEHPDEADELGARGREAVRTTYNWEHEAEQLLAAYERLTA